MIEDNLDKSQAFITIATNTNDTMLLQRILEISQYLSSFNARYRALFSLPPSLHVSYTNHPIKQKLDSTLLGANEALAFVLQVSHESILEHYGIVFEKELTPTQKLRNRIQELILMNHKQESLEIKQMLLSDIPLCKTFAQEATMDEIAFVLTIKA